MRLSSNAHLPTKENLLELSILRKKIRNNYKLDTEKSMVLCSNYILLSNKYNSPKDMAHAYYYNAVCHNYMGENLHALNFYALAKATNKSKDKRLEYKINVSMGVSYRQVGNYQEALKSYTRALDSGLKDGMDVIYNNIAVIFYHLNEFDQAINYASKSFELFYSKNDVFNSLGILNNIGKILILQKKYDEAELQLERTKLIAIKHSFIYHEMISDAYLGSLHIARDFPQKAKLCLENALQLAKKLKNKNQLYSINLSLAKVYQSEGNNELASRLFRSSKRLSQQIGFNEQINFLTAYHGFLSSCSCYKEALLNLKKLRKVTIQNNLDERSKSILEARLLFEKVEYSLNIEKFNSLNEINLQLNVKAKLLKEKNLKLENAVMEMSEAQLLRSQMNPHFIYNSLNSISALIKIRKNFKAINYLQMFATLTRDVYNFSRMQEITLAQELSIVKYYLEMEQLRFTNKFSYQINIESEMILEKIYIPPMIIQPIVENAIKHGIFHLEKSISGNLQINISSSIGFEFGNYSTIIQVIDNGIGLSFGHDFLNSANRESALSITQKRLYHFNKSKSVESNLSYKPVTPHGCAFSIYLCKSKGKKRVSSK